MKLKSEWTLEKEQADLKTKTQIKTKTPSNLSDFEKSLSTAEWASREKILRRFDHEVQGRTLKKPFAGITQESPSDGSLLELPEAKAYVALGHGLNPQQKDFALGVLESFDEGMKRYLLATGMLKHSALLDNYSWPDPIKNDQSLWKLELSGEILKQITDTCHTPFVSGKDSMKNNDSKFRILETLVISVFGSARGPSHAPANYFLEAGQKIYNWAPLTQSLTLEAKSKKELLELTQKNIKELKRRYELLEKWIAEKKIISAKDYSAKSPLKSLFEMTLGRKIGFTAEHEALLENKGTLGALHLVFAPDFNPLKEHPELKSELILMGETSNNFEDFEKFRFAYLKAGEEKLWA